MKKIFILTLIAIFAIPLSAVIPIRGANVWYPQYFTLLSLIFIGTSLSLWKFNKWLSLLNLYCLFSTIVVTQQSMKALMFFLTLNLSSLAMYAISRLDSKQRKKILVAVLIFIILQGCWVILQKFNLDPIFEYKVWGTKIGDVTKDDTCGFSGSHNQLGVFFATTAPVVIYFCPWLLPLIMFGLYCSTTSTALVAFFTSNLIAVYYKSKKIFLYLCILAIVLSGILLAKFDVGLIGSTEARLQLNKEVLQLVSKGKMKVRFNKNITKVVTCNPLLGYGLGNFGRLFPYNKPYSKYFSKFEHTYTHAHNDYIEAFFELGYIGIGLIIALLTSFFVSFVKAVKSKELILYFSCIVAFLICSLGVFGVHIAVSAMWCLLFYGLYRGELISKKEVIVG